MSENSNADPQNELRPRQIKVKFLNSESFPIQSVNVNVQPTYMIVDQVFRYYEPAETTSTSRIPNFVEFIGASSGREVKPLNQCSIESSNKNIEIRVGADDDLLAVVRNGPSLSVRRGYVFVYSDELRSKLLGACKIEIQAVFPLNIKVKAGEEYDYPLKVLLPGIPHDQPAKRKIVEVFSTDSSLIFPPGGRMRNTQWLEPIRDKPQLIPISLMSKQQGSQTARVNVVDLHNHQIIASFMITVDAEKPQIDRAVPVECTLGQQSFQKMKFRNPFDQEMSTFGISSSEIQLIQPKDAIIVFQPNEEKEICFYISQQTVLKTHEAIVHINRIQPDEDEQKKSTYARTQNLRQKQRPVEFEAYSESILFKINVTRANRMSRRSKKVPQKNKQQSKPAEPEPKSKAEPQQQSKPQQLEQQKKQISESAPKVTNESNQQQQAKSGNGASSKPAEKPASSGTDPNKKVEQPSKQPQVEIKDKLNKDQNKAPPVANNQATNQSKEVKQIEVKQQLKDGKQGDANKSNGKQADAKSNGKASNKK